MPTRQVSARIPEEMYLQISKIAVGKTTVADVVRLALRQYIETTHRIIRLKGPTDTKKP